jgi:aspartyl/asparaginyl-tRNA synthetase
MNYPKDIKAFYMRQNDDGKTVAAMDVLAPGIGEIIGGSQREERLDVLDARMDQMGLPKHDYGGTATCAATAPCRTPASASASSARSSTRPASRTSAT